MFSEATLQFIERTPVQVGADETGQGVTNLFRAQMPPLDPDSLDELPATCDMPRYLLDLRAVPRTGPVADRFGAVRCMMTGPQATPVNPLAAFDAVVYVDAVTPWHHLLDQGYGPDPRPGAA